MTTVRGPAGYMSIAGLEQTFRQAAYGALRSSEKRRRQGAYDRLQEGTLEVQVAIFGTASAGAGWTTINVPFDIEFMYAPNQRDIPHRTPSFTWGPVCKGHVPLDGTQDPNNPDNLVFFSAHVTDWSHPSKDSSIVNGARVGVGFSTIGGGDVDFSGHLSLEFSGYGAPLEDNPALDVGQ